MSKINKVNCQMSKIKKVNLDGAYLRSSSGHFYHHHNHQDYCLPHVDHYHDHHDANPLVGNSFAGHNRRGHCTLGRAFGHNHNDYHHHNHHDHCLFHDHYHDDANLLATVWLVTIGVGSAYWVGWAFGRRRIRFVSKFVFVYFLFICGCVFVFLLVLLGDSLAWSQ